MHQYSIVVADDSKSSLLLITAILRAAGYTVFEASNGRDARRLVMENDPQLILLDIAMPEEDGITACRILKADSRTEMIPVLFVSATDNKKEQTDAIAAGGVGFILKPFNRSELLEKIRKAVSQL